MSELNWTSNPSTRGAAAGEMPGNTPLLYGTPGATRTLELRGGSRRREESSGRGLAAPDRAVYAARVEVLSRQPQALLRGGYSSVAQSGSRAADRTARTARGTIAGTGTSPADPAVRGGGGRSALGAPARRPTPLWSPAPRRSTGACRRRILGGHGADHRTIVHERIRVGIEADLLPPPQGSSPAKYSVVDPTCPSGTRVRPASATPARPPPGPPRPPQHLPSVRTPATRPSSRTSSSTRERAAQRTPTGGLRADSRSHPIPRAGTVVGPAREHRPVEAEDRRARPQVTPQ
jgi:hypothetical protein